MAAEIRQYSAQIPAGTSQGAPYRKDFTFPARVVRRVEIRIPPGPSGLMGFALQNSNVTVIPYGSDAFIVTADEVIGWDLQGYPSSGSWQLLGYNTDVFAHTVYCRFLLDLATPPPVVTPPVPDLTGMNSNSPASVAAFIAAAEASAEPVGA